jgi:Holliday junction resolvase-like predicted endonuclease
MTEQQIQSKLIKELESQGYYVIKLMKTNKNGIPDLIAIPRDSNVKFIEVKKPNGKVSKLQEYRLKELENHGIEVEIYKGIKSNQNGTTN